MRYGNDYREYGRSGMRGTGPYSRYNGGRGSGRYRGYDMIDDMRDEYGNYSESRNYGAEGESMKSLDYMLKATHQFIRMLDEEAGSEEERDLIRQYTRKIGEM